MNQQNIILSQIPLENLITAISDAVITGVENKLNLHHKPEPVTEYITRNETAQILGISLPTLNSWSKTGVIPSYRIASRVRYKRAEVLNSLSLVQTIKFKKG